ncbi:vomeronasal type-2 receptor 26-like [Pelobates cultripes]|uniref:Vomeronasal type-2 receptor 26-like n=1 Tax=Pelobates cultripes TaxID=61616 RepID=A0AAD1WN74_PELCU|nr:vomeronasal type-2 receptor 26-like [Pelobates cultripes]
MSGDVIIGGLFDIHIYYKTETFYFSSPPHLQPRKISMLLEDFYNFLSLVFTVDEINRNPKILPNVTLGYNIYDSYVDLFRAVQGAVRLYSGNKKQYPNYNCDNSSVLAAVIEGMPPSFSTQYANIFGIYNYPQISFMSQDPVQSDKQQFPFFYRAIPSEKTLYAAIIALLKHFGWTWIGILYPDDDSSIYAIKIIKQMMEESGGCVEFIKMVPSINDFSVDRIVEIQNIISNSTVNVILVYGSKNYVYYLEQNVHLNYIPGKIWIHTAESSFRMFNIVNDTSVNGTLRFVMHKKEIPDYIKFIQNVDPKRFPTGRTFTTWWDELCENRCPFNPRKRNCTGVESGRFILYSHCNLRFTAMSYSVYNAVYAVGHALHEMYQETPLNERLLNMSKLRFQDLKAWKLHRYLTKVHFTNTMGDEIYFKDDEITKMLSSSIARDRSIAENITVDHQGYQGMWLIDSSGKFRTTPRSVCSKSCPPGKRKSVQKGKPVCCYDCLQCPEGQFSNETDMEALCLCLAMSIRKKRIYDTDVCIKCLEDQWPNEQKTACKQKVITYLSYEDPIGIILTFIALLFSFMSAGVFGIFIKYQDTPIVKANNRDLSYILLISLIFSFLCCLLFIERPGEWTCFFRQAIFGVTFSISVSSLLAKTFIVVIAFNATKPGKNLRKWVGAKIPKYIVLTCSATQVLICVLWLIIAPPSSYYNTQSEVGKIIVECNQGSAIAFYTILGYLCILASVSFIIAFMARKLPDTFNDAKLITFCMLVFITVWSFFIPTYLSAKGTATVAVEVFAILASSSGLLVCIFAPKSQKSSGSYLSLKNLDDLFKELGLIMDYIKYDIPSPSSLGMVDSSISSIGRGHTRKISLVFAVDEINRDPKILPNVTLGYNVYDSYVDLFRAVQGAVRLYSGNKKQYPNYNCDNSSVLAAVIEGMPPSFSIQYANIFGIYNYPQISFMSQDPVQSDKQQFPFFYRAIPSEKTLYAAIIALLKHFGWTWIGIIYPDDDSSINAIKIIKQMIAENGGCIEFIKIVPAINDYSKERIMDIQNTIEKSTANVILVYGSKNYVYYLEQNVHVSNIPGKVWINTADSSFRLFKPINDTVANGSLQFIMHKEEFPDYINFIRTVDPARFPPGRTFTTWWDELCQNRCTFGLRKRNCTGVESGRIILYSHCNLRFTAMSYSVYNSVYVVAHALHKLLTFQDLKPWKLHNYLKKVYFTNTMGQDIYFNKDELSIGYDIYNLVYLPNGTINSVKVGSFDYNAPPGNQTIIDKNAILWESKFSEIPRSVCSESCKPGYRKSVREGQQFCCYDCMQCPEGQFSNQKAEDMDVCEYCPEDQWPNEQKTACDPKVITFLSYDNPTGIVLIFIAVLFSVVSTGVLDSWLKRYQDSHKRVNFSGGNEHLSLHSCQNNRNRNHDTCRPYHEVLALLLHIRY